MCGGMRGLLSDAAPLRPLAVVPLARRDFCPDAEPARGRPPETLPLGDAPMEGRQGEEQEEK